jgi:hypothetical protein
MLITDTIWFLQILLKHEQYKLLLIHAIKKIFHIMMCIKHMFQPQYIYSFIQSVNVNIAKHNTTMPFIPVFIFL